MLRRIVVVVLSVLALAAPATVPAHAGDADGPVYKGGGGWNAFAQGAGVRITGTPGWVSDSGNVGDAPYIEPPTCWYKPEYSPAEAEAYLKSILVLSTSGSSIGYDWGQRVKALLEETGKRPFHEGEEGIWYGSTCSLDASADEQEAWMQAHPLFVWVGPGYPGLPADAGITVEMLAAIARAHLTVPHTPVQSSPAGNLASYVNLPTWLWTGPQVGFVRAEIPGLWAQVTATKTGLVISGPPADATLYPDDGTCPGLGDPYAHQVGVKPSCGIAFGYSGRGVQLGLTLNWNVGWTSSTGAGDPNWDTAGVDQNQAFNVAEVQAPGGR